MPKIIIDGITSYIQEELAGAEIVKNCLDGKQVTYVYDGDPDENPPNIVYRPLDKGKILSYIDQESFESLVECASDYGWNWFENVEQGDLSAVLESMGYTWGQVHLDDFQISEAQFEEIRADGYMALESCFTNQNFRIMFTGATDDFDANPLQEISFYRFRGNKKSQKQEMTKILPIQDHRQICPENFLGWGFAPESVTAEYLFTVDRQHKVIRQ